MELKKVEETLVAIHSLRTSLSKISEVVGVMPNLMYEQLKQQGIEAVAPQIWNYVDCDGKMDTEFTLEICIPVNQKGENTEIIYFDKLRSLSCVSHLHKGAWSEFGSVYEKLFSDIAIEEHKATGNCREVYHHCDFEDQSKCVTEIQIEIQ